MQFTFHQLISFVAIFGGSVSLYTGIAGEDILLYLCGAAIVAAATVPNRKVDIELDIKGFKFGMKLLPDNEADSRQQRNRLGSSDQPQDQLPEYDEPSGGSE